MSEPSSAPRGSNTGGKWPRLYLLSIFNRAIEHGHIVLAPISEADAKSLGMSLRNQLRRSEVGGVNEHHIRPEFRMVSVGQWEPGDDGHGQLPVLYSTTPQGLPGMWTADGSPLDAQTLAPVKPPSLFEATEALEAAGGPDEDLDIDDYVQKMLEQARRADT
jgi:hypothetical protein